MKLIAFGLCVGAGVQAWRNFPADGPVTIGPAVLVMCLAVLAAYLVGRGVRGVGSSATAVAVASASAESTSVAGASSTVNLAVVIPGQGAASAPMGVQIPSESAPWLGGSKPVPELADLDGYDLSELGFEETGEHA
ncbi:hypothetical protein [Nocardioides sp. HB32]